MSWFIAVLRSVRVGMLVGRGLLTLSRLPATTPSAHREAQIQQWACAVLHVLGCFAAALRADIEQALIR
jgi:hypothetical protein